MNITDTFQINWLALNFHKSFLPERRYLTALLQYAAGERQGTDQEISEATGIPVGQSTGKVPSIINYSVGMGLIRVEKGSQPRQRCPILTDFGRIVLLEDEALSEPLTQCLAHLHLCRFGEGAEIWHHTFGPGRDVLGMVFAEADAIQYLDTRLSKTTKSHVSLMLRTYDEQSALKNAGVLECNQGSISRAAVPVLQGFVFGYAAFMLSLWESRFSTSRQVAWSDFEAATCWQRIMGWSDQQNETVLGMLQEAGALDVDRQMRPWVLSRKAEAKAFWRVLYDDLS